MMEYINNNYLGFSKNQFNTEDQLNQFIDQIDADGQTSSANYIRIEDGQAKMCESSTFVVVISSLFNKASRIFVDKPKIQFVHINSLEHVQIGEKTFDKKSQLRDKIRGIFQETVTPSRLQEEPKENKLSTTLEIAKAFEKHHPDLPFYPLSKNESYTHLSNAPVGSYIIRPSKENPRVLIIDEKTAQGVKTREKKELVTDFKEGKKLFTYSTRNPTGAVPLDNPTPLTSKLPAAMDSTTQPVKEHFRDPPMEGYVIVKDNFYNVSTDHANQILEQKSVGTFLFHSSPTIGEFYLSYVDQNQEVQRFPIKLNQDQTYTFGADQKAGSLKELLLSLHDQTNIPLHPHNKHLHYESDWILKNKISKAKSELSKEGIAPGTYKLCEIGKQKALIVKQEGFTKTYELEKYKDKWYLLDPDQNLKLSGTFSTILASLKTEEIITKEFDGALTPTKAASSTIAKETYHTFESLQFYHANLNQGQAATALENCNPGTWLLRPSSHDDSVTISAINEKNECVHLRMKAHNLDGSTVYVLNYQGKNEVYEDIPSMIQGHPELFKVALSNEETKGKALQEAEDKGDYVTLQVAKKTAPKTTVSTPATANQTCTPKEAKLLPNDLQPIFHSKLSNSNAAEKLLSENPHLTVACWKSDLDDGKLYVSYRENGQVIHTALSIHWDYDVKHNDFSASFSLGDRTFSDLKDFILPIVTAPPSKEIEISDLEGLNEAILLPKDKRKEAVYKEPAKILKFFNLQHALPGPLKAQLEEAKDGSWAFTANTDLAFQPHRETIPNVGAVQIEDQLIFYRKEGDQIVETKVQVAKQGEEHFYLIEGKKVADFTLLMDEYFEEGTRSLPLAFNYTVDYQASQPNTSTEFKLFSRFETEKVINQTIDKLSHLNRSDLGGTYAIEKFEGRDSHTIRIHCMKKGSNYGYQNAKDTYDIKLRPALIDGKRTYFFETKMDEKTIRAKSLEGLLDKMGVALKRNAMDELAAVQAKEAKKIPPSDWLKSQAIVTRSKDVNEMEEWFAHVLSENLTHIPNQEGKFFVHKKYPMDSSGYEQFGRQPSYHLVCGTAKGYEVIDIPNPDQIHNKQDLEKIAKQKGLALQHQINLSNLSNAKVGYISLSRLRSTSCGVSTSALQSIPVTTPPTKKEMEEKLATFWEELHAPTAPASQEYVAVKETLPESYYKLNSTGAANYLSEFPTGTYLVRPSSSWQYHHTVSYIRTDGECQHHRISKRGAEYVAIIQGTKRSFSSLDDLAKQLVNMETRTKAVSLRSLS